MGPRRRCAHSPTRWRSKGMETLVELLDRSAARYPDRTAVVMRAGVRSMRYTYPDLAARARSFAALMQSEGLAPGDRLVVWSPNQPDWVAAMFGAFMAGVVVVPLDVNCSREFVARV